MAMNETTRKYVRFARAGAAAYGLWENGSVRALAGARR